MARPQRKSRPPGATGGGPGAPAKGPSWPDGSTPPPLAGHPAPPRISPAAEPASRFSRFAERIRPWILGVIIGFGILIDIIMVGGGLSAGVGQHMVRVGPSLVWKIGLVAAIILVLVLIVIKHRHTRPNLLMGVAVILSFVWLACGLGAGYNLGGVSSSGFLCSSYIFWTLGLYYISQFKQVTWALAWFGVSVVGQGLIVGWTYPSPESWLYPLVALDALAAVVAIVLGTRRRHIKDLIERNRMLAFERDQQTQLAVVAERNRIAGEMHDIVSHSLAVMVTLADGARRALPDDTATAQEAVTQIGLTGRQATADMRRLLAVLRSDSDLAPQPGLADLPRLVADFRETGVPVTLELASSLPADPSLGLAVYRIVQEGLTNVLRHASGASWVRASVTRPAPGQVGVQVVNGPVHLSTAAAVGAGAGQGLLGIRARVEVWEGAMEAGPTPEGGWRLAATLTVADG